MPEPVQPEPKHGGHRPGAGRKPHPEELQRVTVTLEREQVSALDRLTGSVSAHVREAVRRYLRRVR